MTSAIGLTSNDVISVYMRRFCLNPVPSEGFSRYANPSQCTDEPAMLDESRGQAIGFTSPAGRESPRGLMLLAVVLELANHGAPRCR